MKRIETINFNYEDLNKDFIFSGYYDDIILQYMKNKHYLYDAENILSIYEWLNKNEVAIDVGAHIGTQSIPFSFYSKYVLSFEPQHGIYDLLLQNIKQNKANNVIAFNCGVGHKNILTIMNKFSDVKSKHAFNYGTFGIGHGKEIIQLVKLDDFYSSKHNIQLIKIDVEGMEKFVIYGAKKLIKKYHPLLIVEDITKEPTDDIYELLNIEKNNKVRKFNIINFLQKNNYKYISVLKDNKFYKNYLITTYYKYNSHLTKTHDKLLNFDKLTFNY